MSTEQPTADTETDVKLATKKSTSFHVLPNKETGHLVKDPLTIPAEKVPADDPEAVSPSFHLLPNSETGHLVKDPLVVSKHGDAADDTQEKSPSFHRLPNSKTFKVVKDPLKLK